MGELFVMPQIRKSDLSFVDQFEKSDLCYALSRFIREVRRIDGYDFPPNSIREIIIMIQMYLQQSGIYWKLFDDPEFSTLHNIVDNTMKERMAKGMGVRSSCEIISLAQEEIMFKSGALGKGNPEQLLRTVIYMLGLHLALRGGVEHLRLRRPGFESQIVSDIDEKSGKEILVYPKDPFQKNNQGGLTSRQNNKIVRVFPASDISRCPMRLYLKYIRLLPENKSCGKLYLRPRPKFSPSVWYCDQPYGKNKVSGAVKKLCEIAKIEGKYSNHSLRATSASRMFQHNVSEQVIKEITGHKSDCVRTYKRTSTDILEDASKCISGEKVSPKSEESKVNEGETGNKTENCKEQVKM